MSTPEHGRQDGDTALAARAPWLSDYRFGLRVTERGRVLSIGDGIARVSGLPSAAIDEILRFEDGSRALVLSLDRDSIGAIMLDQEQGLGAGAAAYLTGQPLGISVGDALLGRVIDPLGVPLDGGAAPDCSGWRALDPMSPPIVARDYVNEPLYTGNKLVDTLIPVGKGQRQLIIGDNGLGKSTFAIDAAINQKDKGVLCVYVLIGQKRSATIDVIEALRGAGALVCSTVVVAEATAPPGLQYLAPFAGCAVAEGWMAQGRDTLVVYDDLSTHARAYRELSLLLRRPPGREAYPGDIFHLHARLLERSTRLAPAHGGGSMTALPIAETREGEIAAYIPTNLISITDGQIYFDRTLFAAGMLPAIDVTRSVSRIGGAAQHPSIKQEAGRIKLDYLQFLELELFTRFGARLEASVEAKIRHGRALREIFRQDKRSPLPIELERAWLIAYNDGLFDPVPPEEIPAVLRRLAAGMADAGLRLEDDRNRWARAVGTWLGPSPAEAVADRAQPAREARNPR